MPTPVYDFTWKGHYTEMLAKCQFPCDEFRRLTEKHGHDRI